MSHGIYGVAEALGMTMETSACWAQENKACVFSRLMAQLDNS